MKVGFLAGTLGRGGAERQLIYMLQALKAEQIETRVLCLTKGEAFEKDIRELGVEVEWIGNSQNQFVRLGKIMRNIRKHPVDIMQSAHFYTNIYTSLAGRALGIRDIGAIRSDMLNEIASNGVFSKWQLRMPRTLIANSQVAIDRAIYNGIDPANIHLVRNVVVNAKDVNTKEVHDSKNEDLVRVLFAGRLVQAKRCDLFIEMASNLLKRLPGIEFEFVIAGDGPLRSGLERIAGDNGLSEPTLRFLGEQPDMSGVYKDSDILVLTSEHEGTPNVILEAMAHGLPVVATRVGGVPNVVNNGCGILVEPSNVEGLVSAASKLVLDRGLRLELGTCGREYVGKNHSIGYLQDRLKYIYSGVLGTPETVK